MNCACSWYVAGNHVAGTDGPWLCSFGSRHRQGRGIVARHLLLRDGCKYCMLVLGPERERKDDLDL